MGGGNHKKLFHFLRGGDAAVAALSSPRSFSPSNSSSASDDDSGSPYTSSSSPSSFVASSPLSWSSSSSSSYNYSPPRSPWAYLPGLGSAATGIGLVASLVKQDGGKVYSLAAAGDVLYTGTDSDTVRVWRDRRELSGFRTGSGLVKAIVVAGDGRIFTGHQDGKVRVWRRDDDSDRPHRHRRVGSLPALGDFLASSVNPSCYVDAPPQRRRRRAVWLRHSDAVSCLSLDEAAGLLYSGSWDRTVKAWRLSDSRCLESLPAHDDAVNAVAAAGFDGLVLTGSADGTIKVWRRCQHPNDGRIRHVLDRVLRNGEGAVTAIAVAPAARTVYVGSSDGLVTCWRWLGSSNGSEPVFGGALAGHRTAVLCLAVSGTVLASGSADRTVSVWRRDGAEHFRLALLAGHTGPVKCVAVADEDEDQDDDDDEPRQQRRFVVYSGSLDGSVKVWRLQSDDDVSPAAAAEPTVVPTPPHPQASCWPPEPLLPPLQQPWAPHQQAPELKHVAAA